MDIVFSADFVEAQGQKPYHHAGATQPLAFSAFGNLSCFLYLAQLILGTLAELIGRPRPALEELDQVMWLLLFSYCTRISITMQNLQLLKDHLVPFFFTQVPTSKAHKGELFRVHVERKCMCDLFPCCLGANLYGSFIALPESLQRSALQLIFLFDYLPPKLLKALTACCTLELDFARSSFVLY